MNNRLTEADQKRIWQLYSANLNLRQICHLTGRSRPTVRKVLGEMGVDLAEFEPGRPTSNVTIESQGADWQNGSDE